MCVSKRVKDTASVVEGDGESVRGRLRSGRMPEHLVKSSRGREGGGGFVSYTFCFSHSDFNESLSVTWT